MKSFTHSALAALSFLLFASGPALKATAVTPPIIPSETSVSTVPSNGDVNPYGVTFVPANYAGGGYLKAGDILVSNYNSNLNLQGTGTTIMHLMSSGQVATFYQGKPGMGLTTALGVLKRGFVLVGNVPTFDGTFATIQQGSLLILNANGQVVATLTDSQLLDGPWDLAINDLGSTAQVFVSNVLSGTITRIDLNVPASGNDIVVTSKTRIASGFLHRGDPAALAIGPAGLAYDATHDLLYVASTGDNAIFVVSSAKSRSTNAGVGKLVYLDNVHLHGPLGLALAPNGHLITANSDAVNADPAHPSEIVEFTTTGQFVSQMSVNNSGLGGAFGIALSSTSTEVYVAAVDDLLNELHIWTIGL